MNRITLLLGVILVSIVGVTYIGILRGKVSDLESQVEIRDLQIKINADNVELLAEQLAFEKLNQETGANATSELNEVPEVDRNTPLPSSVQGVLDRFNSSIRP